MHFVDAKGILTGSKGHYGMNIYRGCTHGCIYCDSRSRCYQFTHPFEDIEVKQNAPALLVLAVDFILFGNMMNVISMHQKGMGFTMLISLLIIAALGLLVANVLLKDRAKK